METENYYHLFANGDEAKNLIVSESDYYAAFNLIGVCAANTAVKVVSFSVEDSHPHVLLFGRKSDCHEFMSMYERSIMHHIVESRKTTDGVVLMFDMYPVTNDEYLRNVAVYTIIQPTKDGKSIMPFDYPWGSGALYFRPSWMASVWQLYPDGRMGVPYQAVSISKRHLQSILYSKREIPGNWLICNGFLLPSNYVATDLFEGIFVTHNCYRVFLGNSSRKNEMVINRMVKIHGIILEDYEARRISENVCMSLFGKRTARWLTPQQRLVLARNLKRERNMTLRQIATLSRLPESELKKYLK